LLTDIAVRQSCYVWLLNDLTVLRVQCNLTVIGEVVTTMINIWSTYISQLFAGSDSQCNMFEETMWPISTLVCESYNYSRSGIVTWHVASKLAIVTWLLTRSVTLNYCNRIKSVTLNYCNRINSVTLNYRNKIKSVTQQD